MTLRGCWPLVILLTTACQPQKPVRPVPPEVSGSTLLLDVAPATRPAMIGAYDFELLDAVGGSSCISRSNRSSVYWVGLQDLAMPNSDRVTQQAIAAAAYDAISRLEEADTIVLTRVVATGKGSDRVCVTVFGRGIRLIKAKPSSSAIETKQDDNDDE